MNLKQLKNLPGARKTAMPEFVQPQLATLMTEAPKGDEWLHELKFDGYRLLCFLERGHVRLWTRNQKDWTEKFPDVVKALKTLKVQSAILDGEIVALDATGRSSFQMLQQSIKQPRGRNLVLHVFDLLYLDGYDLRRCSLQDRRGALRALLDSAGALTGKSRIRFSDEIRSPHEDPRLATSRVMRVERPR